MSYKSQQTYKASVSTEEKLRRAEVSLVQEGGGDCVFVLKPWSATACRQNRLCCGNVLEQTLGVVIERDKV